MSLSASFSGQGRRWLFLAGLLPALHLAMLVYDLQHPDRFLNGDRARWRMQVLESFQETWRGGGDLAGFIAQHGIVGDWLPQALLYLWAGRAAVIAVQVLLALLSVFWVYCIGLRLQLEPGTARSAALLYALLPHTLIFPHQLVSEAFYAPLVVGSFALLARAVHTQGRSLWGSGAALGLATLVRPITLLWPILLAPWVPAARWARAAYLLAAYGPVLCWTLFILGATGEFSMGRSTSDLGHNLYSRAERLAIAAGLPASERPHGASGEPSLSVREYLAFAFEHPAAALAHNARDMLVLGTKSGVERILIDYLDLFPAERAILQAPRAGWRRELERTGPWATLASAFGRNPPLVLAATGGAVLFVGIMVLAISGALGWLRAPRAQVPAPGRTLRILITAFPVYVLMTTQTVNSAQSRHRAPAEFALCLLAASGLAERRPRRERRDPSVELGGAKPTIPGPGSGGAGKLAAPIRGRSA